MACCCVPFCNSYGKRTKDISFHEFPIKAERREQWLRVIARKDWSPNDNSNSSRVCSLHFEPSDFKAGTIRKLLMPSAVPSIFPNYPSYMQPPKKKQRSTSSIEKRTIQEAKQHTLPEYSELEDQDAPISSNSLSEDEVTKVRERPLLKNAEVQVDVIRSEKENVVLRNWKNKYKNARSQVKTLQNKLRVKKFKSREDPATGMFKKVLASALEGDESAMLLVDLVKNFTKNSPRWSENTIYNCILWRNISPKGYDFAGENNILRLPTRSTMQRYVGNMTEFLNEMGEIQGSKTDLHKKGTAKNYIKGTNKNHTEIITDPNHTESTEQLNHNELETEPVEVVLY